MEIRAEKSGDIAAIRMVNLAAFGRDSEANLVDQLRGVASTLSLVAVEAEQIVGHVFFSPVTIEGTCPDPFLMLGLGPVAVLPDRQRQGIGSLLIHHGLEVCRQLGCKAVVVLGYPEYYRRFGFGPAKQKGLSCEYPVPNEVFMVLELEPDALVACQGLIKYRPEFHGL